MENVGRERRKYPRYDTELKIYYRVKYDLKTRVKFQVIINGIKNMLSHKYSGVSENISIEGLRFSSRKGLKEGDLLYLEVYMPNIKRPVKMEGRVAWCRHIPSSGSGNRVFHTGVEVLTVNGRPVKDSIHFDKEYRVMWSDMLEMLFGTFSGMLKHIKK